MCGLCALYAYGDDAPPVDAAELKTINDAMFRRGPDGEGRWISEDGRVGLGHRRLAIIDLSAAAAQPMVLEASDGQPPRYHMTYNGEIYNFRDLRRDLEQFGVQFKSHSDTEVILRLYEREGAAMLSKLRGMYAIAIWDNVKKRLFLARDPYGIKPLYYADDGQTVRVASQVKALLAGGKIDTTPHPAGHAGFFLFGSVPDPHTLFAGISALPAGHWMEIGANGNRKTERFFDTSAVLAERTEAAAVDLREALLDSVRHHFVADVPVGVFLSAGLDSTSILALAAECQGERLETVTLGFDEFAGDARDEVALAEEVSAVYGTNQHTERVSSADFNDAYDDILGTMDQPTLDGVNTYFVARATRRAGLKVALSGLGGDELFGGYDTFRQVPELVRRVSMIPASNAVGKLFRKLSAPFVGNSISPKAPGVFEYGGTYGGSYLLRRGLYMPWELPKVLDTDMARQGLLDLAPMSQLDQASRSISEPKRKVAALETAFYMRNQLLRDSDWAGMANSLEIRVPLVDPILLKSLLPAILKPGGLGKRDMALTPKTPLPSSIINRPKTGFCIPVDRWIQDRIGVRERGFRGWAKAVYASASTLSK
jgi:asparagine synthase (glutamine-hydrolysing)